MPHTRAMGKGLFELRMKGKEGIGRAFFCNRPNRRIMMLHAFVKKDGQDTQEGIENRATTHRRGTRT